MTNDIHTSAVIEPGAELGESVTVGPAAYIQAGTRIGDGSRIDAGVVIYRGVTLGEQCQVHAHAVLGDTPQDMAFENHPSHVRIGARCVMREGFTIHRGTKADTTTVVGEEVFFMANSHVGHNCEIGDRAILANGVLLAGYVKVGAGAFLSGNCVVHQFCRVGRLAMMSGLSACSKDLPPFCIATNTETNQLSGVNVVGLRRAGLGPEERKQIRTAFRLLFLTGQSSKDACLQIRSEFPGTAAEELADFVESSQRGVCGYHRS